METYRLLVNHQYHVIICEEHGRVIPYDPHLRKIQDHLRREHAAKGKDLKDCMQELDELQLPNVSADRLPKPVDGGPPIQGLPLLRGYQCTMTACNHERESLSQSEATIKRHQSRVHYVGRTKSVRRAPDMIRQVMVQCFFPKEHNRLFVVAAESPLLPPTRMHAVASEDPTFLATLQNEYQTSQENWEATFNSLPVNENLYQTQTPPWLTTTGIFPFIQGLGMEKDDLMALVAPFSESKSTR